MKPHVIAFAARAGNVIEAALAGLLPGRDAPLAKTLRVIPHRSVGDARRLTVAGRMVRMAVTGGQRPPVGEARSASRQLVTIYRAFDVVEMPFVAITVSLGDQTADGQSDAGGFFAIDLPAPPGAPWAGGWHHPRIQVAEAGGTTALPAEVRSATGDVFVPPAGASLVIVSDLDDTAMDTQSARQLQMLRKVLFSCAQRREPVPGVPGLYRALQRGRTDLIDARRPDATADRAVGHGNPLCYISSGAWNLYDQVVDYLDLHGLPMGAVYLNDWGSRGRSFHTVAHEHKGAHVGALLARFPSLPFLLIGDDVQEDPELYAMVAVRHPGRVKAIWIRTVCALPARLAEIESLRASLDAAGTELVVAPDTDVFTRHARARGWID